MGFVYIAIGIVTLVMEAIAIPKLLKRQLGGWKLVYWASLLSALSSLLSLSIASLVLGLIISMFILFQIREYYK
jgi:branched-subunit amino acid transport protein